MADNQTPEQLRKMMEEAHNAPLTDAQKKLRDDIQAGVDANPHPSRRQVAAAAKRNDTGQKRG
jgi:hypothetical protein